MRLLSEASYCMRVIKPFRVSERRGVYGTYVSEDVTGNPYQISRTCSQTLMALPAPP